MLNYIIRRLNVRNHYYMLKHVLLKIVFFAILMKMFWVCTQKNNNCEPQKFGINISQPSVVCKLKLRDSL